MSRFPNLFSLFNQKKARMKTDFVSSLKNEAESPGKFSSRSKLRKLQENQIYKTQIFGQESSQSARIKMYRFLSDNIPVLNSAIWTWTSLSASPIKINILDCQDDDCAAEAEQILESLFERVYDNDFQKFAGVPSLLLEYFNSLYVTGSVAGEVVLNSQKDGLDYFYFVDTGSLGFNLKNGLWRIYQNQNDRKIWFDLNSCYYYGLNADSVNPSGKSLLGSVPFVARVEQQLVDDMQKSMHNAGYHRIHVQVTPPERMSGESENNYISRANGYFEKTVNMFKDFRTEDNPITWDDVKIDYISPAAKTSSSNSWYISHKAVLEDICAGLHLAPFMLGYSYGTTHNWAMFKYELVQREVRAIQMAASGFLEWLANLELALKGFNVRCQIRFENEEIYGLTEKADAEHTRVKTIVMKKEAGLVDEDQARREIDNIKSHF